MKKSHKLWTGLGITALAGTITAQAAVSGQQIKHHPFAAKDAIILADASGEGGEGGEAGEAGGTADDGAERTGYLKDLALVEGHMLVGVALYKAGDAEMAKTHMKHPADELYADLTAHFDRLKIDGFATELQSVSAALEAGAEVSIIDTKMEELLNEIAESRGGAMEAHEAAAATAVVVRTAAEEFSEGVKDGKVVETHEYQDAWGFVKAAQRLLEALSDEEKNEHKDALAAMSAELSAIELFFPDILGKSTVAVSAADFAAAASRLELAASVIK